MNNNKIFRELQFAFAIFTDDPSPRNFLEAQKAMIAYQEYQEYYDQSNDYLCEGFPGKKVEYRITINAMYDNPNCPGYQELEHREGYYVIAYSPQDALEKMRSRYPDFASEGFTVEVWKVLD